MKTSWPRTPREDALFDEHQKAIRAVWWDGFWCSIKLMFWITFGLSGILSIFLHFHLFK